MRLLLLLLLLASSCYAAGLEYGGLTTIVPGPSSKPSNYFSVSSPASELYFTWSVPQPGGSEWYSFEIDFAVVIDSSKGFCFEIAPANQLTYSADCKSCTAAGNVITNPQPGPWFARVTNCRVASSAASEVKVVALVFSAVICPPNTYGALCNNPIMQMNYNQTYDITVKAGQDVQYFSYSFDNSPGVISWVNWFHNISFNPQTAGQPSYTTVEMASTLLQNPLPLDNDIEGTDFLDVTDNYSPPDYDVAGPTGRNVVALSNVMPQGAAPADHQVSLLAEAIICTPPRFGEQLKVSCPYFFTDVIAVDPTKATQTISVSGSFNPNDVHSHTNGKTHLFKFYNLTLPYAANLLYVTKISGDAVVALGYRAVSSAYNPTVSINVVPAGGWILGVTSQTNSSFELSVTIEICPNDCSTLGTCQLATATCQCIGGSIGPVCQQYSDLLAPTQAHIPAKAWAFFGIVVNQKNLKELTVTIEVPAEPAKRVAAMLSYPGDPIFPLVTTDPSKLPFVADNRTNTIVHGAPVNGLWMLGVYNAFEREEQYAITSNIWAGPSPGPSPAGDGVNVVSTMVILFIGIFAISLLITAWIRWAAARGGYVSIR